jgi:hypothetical protein
MPQGQAASGKNNKNTKWKADSAKVAAAASDLISCSTFLERNVAAASVSTANC